MESNFDKWLNVVPLTYIESNEIHICLEYRTVKVLDEEISLTATEFDILTLLVMNPKRVFTYEMISDLVWNEPYDLCSRKTITNHISNIRKKLRSVSTMKADCIKSVHRIGYKYNGDAEIHKRMP